jgi:Zn-dependent M28 family amino/carboxypeptidase
VEKHAPPRPADRYDSRLALLEKLGAKAALALEAGLEATLSAKQDPAGPYFLGAKGLPRGGEPPLARVALAPDLLGQLRAGQADSATLAIRGREKDLLGFNVLGRLEGSDPALRHEAILIGAHMDHLGRPGGVLHPGADDNASGVAALLEIARAFAQSPVRPRRTVLVAFWTGEEEGKFGSGHYVRHPRWPLAATAAYLNLDMIGHAWTPADLRALAAEARAPEGFLEGLDPACFAEPGLSAAHRDLGPFLARAGRGTGMALHLDWTDGRNGGSDYRDFARRGLPFVRFFGSYFPEYHRPGDTLDRLDPGQVQRMARLVLATAWLLADR